MPKFETLEAEYMHYESTDRQLTMDRVREFVALTIPRLIPDEELWESSDFPEPWESLPGRGVSQLAAKISAALIPLNNIPFFAFEYSDPDLGDEIEDTEELEGLELIKALQTAIHQQIWASNARETLYQGFKHLIVTGSVCIHQTDDYAFRVFPMNQYVCQRDHEGNVKSAVIMEYMDTSLLPPDLAGINGGQPKTSKSSLSIKNLEPHYTKMVWDYASNSWKVTKEFRHSQYETGEYIVLPYYFLIWDRVGSENWGRSLVEENCGSIRTLQGLAEAFVKLTAAIAKVLPYCDPTGITNVNDLQEAEDLDWVSARASDIGFLQLNAMPQMQEIAQALMDKRQEIKDIFLMNMATQLRGERVTATQVQAAIQELESALGGIFSTMVTDIQLPIILRSLAIMQKNGQIPAELAQLLGSDLVNINIKTGLDAIGREMEGAKLQALLGSFAPIPEMVEVLNLSELARRLILNMGIDPKGIVKTREQVAEEQQAAQQAQMQQQLSDTAITTVGRMAEKGLLNG